MSNDSRVTLRHGARVATDLAIILAILLSIAFPHAAARDEDREAYRAMETGEVKPISDLLTRIHAQFPGRILKIELEREESGRPKGWIYEAKVLTTRGSVLKLEYDAGTLELLAVKGHYPPWRHRHRHGRNED